MGEAGGRYVGERLQTMRFHVSRGGGKSVLGRAAPDDKISGVAGRWLRTMRFHVSRGGEKSVLGRAAPDDKISGVAGRREVGTCESGSGR